MIAKSILCIITVFIVSSATLAKGYEAGNSQRTRYTAPTITDEGEVAAPVANGPIIGRVVEHGGEDAVNSNGSTALSNVTPNPSAPVLQRIKQDALSCKDEWSGSLDDLKTLVDRAKQKYGRESTKHMGRNATMIVPANLGEMKKWLEREDYRLGNFVYTRLDGFHAKSAEKDDGYPGATMNILRGSGVEKYQVEKGPFKGAEAVYDKKTGEIVKDWRMGTRNYSYVMDGNHTELDVDTHEKNPEYKYVGILVETDPSDPNKYYIVNGQTGKRMTWREAEDFPTTLSDEWKDIGLACVADDAKDVIEPDQCRDEARCIDTSKLEALLKEQIAFVKALLAKGEKATQEEIDTYNSRQKKIAQEGIGIAGKINSMAKSKEDANRITERELGSLMPLAEQLTSLVDQVVERGIVDHLESMSLNDLNSTATHQSTSDDSCCMCQVPEPNITVPPAGPGWAKCQKCGKMIGTVIVQDGKVSVVGKNPVANEMVERMVKDAKASNGK